MPEFVVHLVFYGLIAFAPNSLGRADLMTAYVVKGPATGQCIHVPSVAIKKKGVAFCGNADSDSGEPLCRWQEDWCVCSIGGVDLEFDSQTVRRSQTFRAVPRDDLPDSVQEGGEFEWLVRMSNVNSNAGRIKLRNDISDLTEASFSFGWTEARTCHLDERKDGGRLWIYSFEFIRPNGQIGSNHEQALAEMVMFTAHLRGAPGSLVLQRRGGATQERIGLACDGAICPDILIFNAPSRACGGGDVGGHFDHYYNLSRNQITAQERLLPRILPDRVRASRVQPTDCPPPHPLGVVIKRREENGIGLLDIGPLTVGDRIICPMAMFDP